MIKKIRILPDLFLFNIIECLFFDLRVCLNSVDSHFSSLTKYYVKNDHVFFIFKDDTLWQFDGGTPEKPITKDSITQQRIYLQHENPIQCLEKSYTIRSVGKNADPGKVPNKEVKCDVKELMTIYQSILKNKDKKDIPCL